MKIKPPHFLDSLLILLCLIALSGGLVYRFYALNRTGVIISLILAVISFVIIQYYYLISNKKTRRPAATKVEKTSFKFINFLLVTCYLLLILFCFYLLFKHGTVDAITSPWQAVPKYFFIFYSLASLALIGNLASNKTIALPLLTLHYFLSFSVALIVYRLGYGYDPFIHQATEKLIAQAGAVEPKPFYYLGQYALVVIIHKITAAPLVWLDKLLVPLLAALFLPLALWRFLKSWFNSPALNLILILAILALTFPFFIVTTPQNLAYLFLLLAILFGLVCKNYYDYLVIILLAAAALITQPLAGIPAALLCAGLAVYHSGKIKFKKYLYAGLLVIAVGLLPALFYFLNKNLPAAGANAAGALNGNLFGLNSASQSNWLLNFLYFYGFNLKFAIGLLVIGGIFIAIKYREQCRLGFVYLGLALSLIASYLITVRLPFNFLINYEQDNYPQRILVMAGFFLLPFIIISVYALLEKIYQKNNFIKASFIVFLVLLISASLYLSYPRSDDYFNSRGRSLSAADIQAVNWINERASSAYLVLANQQVSAAALSQFGFKKYFQTARGEIFYYPIPTSSPLYQYYLDMVYKKPSRETINAAMALAGVNQGYLVLNKYWRAFAKILAEAKFSADGFQEFGGGQTYVFEYNK